MDAAALPIEGRTHLGEEVDRCDAHRDRAETLRNAVLQGRLQGRLTMASDCSALAETDTLPPVRAIVRPVASSRPRQWM